MKKTFKYIFGPVYSWRLGMSLGIDPLSQNKKVCNFNCNYCQCGKTEEYSNSRKVFVPTEEILSEIKNAPVDNIDYYTFSGNGEPTLAKNLGKMIRAVKEMKKVKVAVITNSSLINLKDVRDDLSLADFVLLKLDACDECSFKEMNAPEEDLIFQNIVEGLIEFRREFKGRMALQIMFTAKNLEHSPRIVDLAKKIKVDEIQVNTPLRASMATPLDEESLLKVKKQFDDFDVTCVYEVEKKQFAPMDMEETKKRHGDF